MRYSLLAALFLWFAVPAPTFAGAPGAETMSLLGVDAPSTAQPLIAAPGNAVAAAAAGPGGASAGCTSALPLDQLKARLHPDGQKRALVIRGGKYGINPYILQIIQRAAAAFGFDPSVKAFLEDNLQRQYISDDDEVAAKLTELGYDVKRLYSSDYQGKLAQFKPDVLAELKKKETAVVVFYGHGNVDHFWMLNDRENNMPGIDELIRNKEMHQPDESISVQEMYGAVHDRGGLDALILHGCQNGTTSYRKEHGGQADSPTFADCVKTGAGFFAGWITFSVYLHADTLPILDRFICHVSNYDPASPDNSKKSARYWSRSGGIGREMSMIAFEGDGSGYDEADLAKDADIVVHTMDYVTKCVPVTNFVHLGYQLKFDPAPLAGLLKGFLIKHYDYCVANRVPMRQEGQGEPPKLSSQPTTAEINALIAYHARPILSAVFAIVAPGLVYLEKESIRLDDADPARLFVDLDFRLQNSQELQKVLDVVRKSQDLVIRDKLNAGVGDHLGNQLADGIDATIKNLRSALGDTIAKVRLALALEKVERQEDGKPSGKYAIKPWVQRYHIAVGDVPDRLAKSAASPYEIHVSMTALDTFVRKSLKNMFPGQIELKYDPGRFLPSLYAYLALRNDMQKPITADGASGLKTTSTWEFMVNWFHIANGYAYADSNISVDVKPAGDLKVSVTPTVNLWLTTGWGLLDAWSSAKLALSLLASSQITKVLQARAASGVDFADFIPDSQKADVVGVVEISRIVVSDDAVSVYIDRKK